VIDPFLKRPSTQFLLLVSVMFLVPGCFLDVAVLLFVAKGLTGIPIGEMMGVGLPILSMLLRLLLVRPTLEPSFCYDIDSYWRIHSKRQWHFYP